VRKYLLRRALFALGTLFGVSLIIFVVLRVIPGDPLVAILGFEGHAKLSPADRAQLMRDLGLADSLPVQYVRWLRDIATGHIGKSFFRGDTVAALMWPCRRTGSARALRPPLPRGRPLGR
jgi:peptide/nickel transport system permease protein